MLNNKIGTLIASTVVAGVISVLGVNLVDEYQDNILKSHMKKDYKKYLINKNKYEDAVKINNFYNEASKEGYGIKGFDELKYDFDDSLKLPDDYYYINKYKILEIKKSNDVIVDMINSEPTAWDYDFGSKSKKVKHQYYMKFEQKDNLLFNGQTYYSFINENYYNELKDNIGKYQTFKVKDNVIEGVFEGNKDDYIKIMEKQKNQQEKSIKVYKDKMDFYKKEVKKELKEIKD